MSELTKAPLAGCEETETRHCENHGEYEAKHLIGTVWTHCPACSAESEQRKEEEIRARQLEAKEDAVQMILNRAGIPKRFRGRTFDDYHAEGDGQERVLKVCKAYAHRFDERLAAGGGLVLCGLPGTGKTHLATAIANHIAKSGRKSLFASVMQITRRVKETFRRDSDETEADAISVFLKPDLVIIDEVGVQFGSDTEKLILFDIINGRYGDMRPTIVISNLPLAELSAYLGERVIDRMQEGGGAVLAFDWASERKNVNVKKESPPQVTDWERLRDGMHNESVGR
jgi:DNA replication protein DnaC